MVPIADSDDQAMVCVVYTSHIILVVAAVLSNTTSGAAARISEDYEINSIAFREDEGVDIANRKHATDIIIANSKQSQHDDVDERDIVDYFANRETKFYASNLRRRHRRRYLLAMSSSSLLSDDKQILLSDTDGGKSEDNNGSGVIINMMRRAKDHVSPTDVPFLLLQQQTSIPPHNNNYNYDIPLSASEAVYNIMTQCYGLIGQKFDADDNGNNVSELLEAKRNNIVDKYFVSADYYFAGGVGLQQQQQQHHHHQSDMLAIQSNTAQRRQLQQRQQPMQRQQQQQHQPFHFIATHHYQEGAALFTPKHRGRVIAILEHPVIIVQRNFIAALLSSSTSSPSLHAASSSSFTNQQQHDALLHEQLIQYVNSTNYIDNTMTRMISNIPYPTPLTEEHFKYARMILENKFLIGMGYDMEETLYKRIKLYFGWRELDDKRGCEAEILKSLTISSNDSKMKKNDATSSPVSFSSSVELVEEGSKLWRFIQRKNLYDMKLYARGMSIFADQKMRLPVHYSVRQQEVTAVQKAFFDGGNLRSVDEFRDASDIPFFW